MTRTVYDDARMYVREHPPGTGDDRAPRPELKYAVHGSYLFKGLDEPVQIFEVGAVGKAPLNTPPDSDKARRIIPELGTSPSPWPWWRRLAFAGGLLLMAAVAGALYVWSRQPAGFELEPPETVFMAVSEVKNTRLSVRRFVSPGPDEPVELTFDNLPPGVTVRPAKNKAASPTSQEEIRILIPARQSTTEVEIRIQPNAQPGVYEIPVHASSTDLSRDSALHLEVAELPYYLPTAWEPVDKDPEPDGNRIYFKKIDVINGGKRVRFHFIPGDVSQGIAAFYIMEDKVWFGLFNHFAREQMASGFPKDSKWKESDFNAGDPEFPVMGVIAPDAHAFARWLAGAKGDLPTTKQWDKAAGRFENPPGDGPFEGTWPDVNVAVDRKTPMKRNESKDVSVPYGLRDMSGNGEEWTRSTGSLSDHREIDFRQLEERLRVLMRGQSFRKREPLKFDFIKTGDYQHGPGVMWLDEPQTDIGFRVVIEL
jgi:hypothetical protein